MWIEIEKLQEVMTVGNLICLAFLLGISVYDIYFHRISKAVLVLANLLAVFYALLQAGTSRESRKSCCGQRRERPPGCSCSALPGLRRRRWDMGTAGWSWPWGAIWDYGDLWRCLRRPGCCWPWLQRVPGGKKVVPQGSSPHDAVSYGRGFCSSWRENISGLRRRSPLGQKGDGSEVGDREKKFREKRGEKELRKKELRKKERPESAEAVSLWRQPS